MKNKLGESLTDMRQHAINGWVAYGCHQMSREMAERMMREYEEAILEEVRMVIADNTMGVGRQRVITALNNFVKKLHTIILN